MASGFKACQLTIYSLNVARLANVPEDVLEVASVKSKELEEAAERKSLDYLSVLNEHQ